MPSRGPGQPVLFCACSGADWLSAVQCRGSYLLEDLTWGHWQQLIALWGQVQRSLLAGILHGSSSVLYLATQILMQWDLFACRLDQFRKGTDYSSLCK